MAIDHRAAPGDGQVQQLELGKWQIRASGGMDSSGKRLRPSRIIYGTRADARRALRQLQEGLDRCEEIEAPTAAPAATTGEWLREWCSAEYGVRVDAARTELLTRGRRPGRTQEVYECIIRVHLLPGLGDIPLASLRPTHLRKYFGALSGTHTEATLRNHFLLVDRALRAAVQEGLIADSPAQRMAGRPRDSREDTPEDVQ